MTGFTFICLPSDGGSGSAVVAGGSSLVSVGSGSPELSDGSPAKKRNI